MKTIEERAKEKYCATCGARTEYNCSPERTPCSYVKTYIKIATEQKKIDIEKAWKWVEEACSKHPITADELSILKQSFKHTMEE